MDEIYDPAAIDGRLGSPWTFHSPGVSIKPHPSGSLTHPAMGVMLDLIRAHDIRPEQVRRVRVGTNRNMPNALIHHRPRTELKRRESARRFEASCLPPAVSKPAVAAGVNQWSTLR